MTSINMTKLMVVLLVGLLALSNTVSVQAKGSLVRGAHSSKTLKHDSMAARRLKGDKDADEEGPVAAEEEEVEDNKEDDDKVADDDETEETPDDTEAEAEEAPKEEAPEEETPDDTEAEAEVDSGIEVPDTDVEDPAEAITEDEPLVVEPLPEVLPGVTPDATPSTPNATDAEVMPDQEFSVALNAFSLTVDGSITGDDLDLEDYLFQYMKTFMPNLVSIDLDSDTVVVGVSEADTAPSADEGNSTRMLRTTRGLTVQTFYYEGTASFVGPPMRSEEEVDAALTYALEDTAALQTHLEATFPSANVAITANTDDPMPTTDSASEEEEETKEDGLSTTGLSIVIVAACVGGISLLVILMVGLSGPSGDTTGMKGGLPEQPLQ